MLLRTKRARAESRRREQPFVGAWVPRGRAGIVVRVRRVGREFACVDAGRASYSPATGRRRNRALRRDGLHLGKRDADGAEGASQVGDGERHPHRVSDQPSPPRVRPVQSTRPARARRARPGRRHRARELREVKPPLDARGPGRGRAGRWHERTTRDTATRRPWRQSSPYYKHVSSCNMCASGLLHAAVVDD